MLTTVSTEKDSKGRFLPGNKFATGGAREGAGQKPALVKATKDIVRAAIAENDSFVPEYLAELRRIATKEPGATVNEKIRCLEYLINRSQGLPKAQTEVKGLVLHLTGDDYLLAALRAQEEVRLMEGEYNATE